MKLSIMDVLQKSYCVLRRPDSMSNTINAIFAVPKEQDLAPQHIFPLSPF